MRIANSEILLWVEEKPAELPQHYLSVLSLREQEEMQKIPNKNRQLEYAMPRFMLRELLYNSYSEIIYDSNGKPTMANQSISISHSKNYVAVIVGKNKTVAVDVEEYREQVMNVAHKFVLAEEKTDFNSLEDLILLWSAKETLFKLTNATPDFKKFRVKKTDKHLCGEVMNEGVAKSIKMSYFRGEKYCLVWTASPI